MAKNPTIEKDTEAEQTNTIEISGLDLFELVTYLVLTTALSFVVIFAYHYGRYYKFNVPFSIMDFSSFSVSAMIGALAIAVFGTLLFKIYVRKDDTSNFEENTRVMENFLAGLTNVTMVVCILFGIVDLMKNASFQPEIAMAIAFFATCLFFYFKSNKAITSRNYLCIGFILVMIFSFFAMGITSTKTERVNLVNIEGRTYRVVQSGPKKTILAGYDRYTGELTEEWAVFFNQSGRHLTLR